MDITLRVVLLVISIFFLIFVLFRVRRGKYLLKYSLVWIFLSLIGVISSIFPEWVHVVAFALGFNLSSNFVYFALIMFLLVVNLVLCGVLSKQETTIKSIVQELSIVKAEQERDNEADARE